MTEDISYYLACIENREFESNTMSDQIFNQFLKSRKSNLHVGKIIRLRLFK
jgi:hypothetical protein